jgi:hypothetical protein
MKLGDMMINNQILSCLIYWSSFINGHEQLQNNFKKESLLCVCCSMYVCNSRYKNKDVCNYVSSSGLVDLFQRRGSG